MMFEGLANGLRWIFWGTAYLTVLVTVLTLVAMMPMPVPLRIGTVLVFVWGIVLDVQAKRRAEDRT